MSIESTRDLTRQEAITWILRILSENMANVNLMSDTELEGLLYSLTRETNKFDNFMIRNSYENTSN